MHIDLTKGKNMYKIFIVLILAMNIYAQDNLTYKDAIEQGIKENKPVMLVLVSKYCSWCNRLKQVVLANEEIKKRTDKEIITVILNKYDYKYPEKFKTHIIPTTFFIDPKNEDELLFQVGYTNKENFKALLDELQEIY